METIQSDVVYETSPLKVIIVGAGIAGLTAAIGLRQQSHQVHIYEQSHFADEVGAAIHISPNANSVLLKLGVDVAERGAPGLLRTRYFDSSCKQLSAVDNEAQSYRWQASSLQAHRGHLHSQLRDRATSLNYSGTPARLYTSSRIVAVDPSNATLTLANGTTVQGDVLLGADGVRSITRQAVAGPEYDSFEIGKNAFRFMVPRAKIMADPKTKEFGESPGTMDLYFAEEHKVITYPCVDNTLLNVVCIHPARQSSASADTYNKVVLRETLLDIFRDFSPKLLRVFEKCDSDTLKVYPLFDALSMPVFVKDRLALIGDAAHSFTPFIGQGGATAIEDAVSIGVILSRDTSRAELVERLQVHNNARHGRATLIQGYSRMAGGDGVKPGEEKAARMKGREYAFYTLSHDEFHASTQILREHKWSKLTQPTWRQSTVFGPMPGFSRIGSLQQGTSMRKMTASITFKTSGTLLRNMLPDKSYNFASKDTVALASLKLECNRNVSWLGGHGFDRVLLKLHGVDYTRRDGSVISGRYLVVAFENSADAISVGREERGYPSVFTGIELDAISQRSLYASLSWKGVRRAKIWLKNLTLTSTAQERAPEPVFVHRRIPNVVGRGAAKCEPDIEEDILLVEESSDLHATNGINGNVKANDAVGMIKSSSNARFEILPFSERELPTLHHIASRVAELPIFDIVGATVYEEEGLEKVMTAQRIS